MGNSDLASLQATVYGYVQGVFFRAFVSRRAEELGLTGYVRNLPGGKAVEVLAEGERKQLRKANQSPQGGAASRQGGKSSYQLVRIYRELFPVQHKV